MSGHKNHLLGKGAQLIGEEQHKSLAPLHRFPTAQMLTYSPQPRGGWEEEGPWSPSGTVASRLLWNAALLRAEPTHGRSATSEARPGRGFTGERVVSDAGGKGRSCPNGGWTDGQTDVVTGVTLLARGHTHSAGRGCCGVCYTQRFCLSTFSVFRGRVFLDTPGKVCTCAIINCLLIK